MEQTANLGGGSIWPLRQIEAVTAVAKGRGLKTHMDGARLMNAVVASGVAARDFAAPFDSAWIDFTKGLGAPVGAALAGSREFIHEAWRLKQQMGGSMRQAGIIAAGGVYALRHNVKRLAEDHANAKRLAEGLAALPGVRLDPASVETNLVFFDLTSPLAANVVPGASWPAGSGGAMGRRRLARSPPRRGARTGRASPRPRARSSATASEKRRAGARRIRPRRRGPARRGRPNWQPCQQRPRRPRALSREDKRRGLSGFQS